jgi:hypothetical protein
VLPRLPDIERYRWLVPYVAIAVVATAMLAVMRIPISRLDVPFVFVGDAIDKLAQIANVAETGWLFHNDRLGYPFGYDRLDFPRFDSLNYALIGPLAALVGPGAAMNLYYIAGFYLIAFTAYWSLRRLGLALAPALLCGLLYAFLPYHVIRGVPHLTNGAYYLVPLAFVALIWLALGRLGTRAGGDRRRLAFALILAVLVPLQMPYNGVFFAYLAVVAGAIAFARGLDWRAVAMTAALLAATALAFVLEQVPLILHTIEAGKPALVADRAPWQAELYSLRLNQVLMPTAADRRPFAARAMEAFDAAMDVPDVESRNQYIGIVGVGGLLALMWTLCRAVAARAPPPATRDVAIEAEAAARIAALFAIALILLTISTGLGTLISFWITSKIRAYNRVLPFLAFLCLVGGGWALQTIAARVRIVWLRNAAFALVAVVALHDILLRPMTMPHRTRNIENYDSARVYFEGIEKRLGDHAAVLQLPALWYPEHLPVNAMGDYEEFKPFLLTRTLRFSYGVGHGRVGYNWNKYVEGLPAPDLIAEAHRMGFSAILVDSLAYTADSLKATTDALAAVLPAAPSVSGEARWWLFPLEGCCGGAAPSSVAPDRIPRAFAYPADGIRFDARGNGALYSARGWEDAESWGAWMAGTHSSVRFRIDTVPSAPLTLVLQTQMLLGPKLPERSLVVTANGKRIDERMYTQETRAQTLSIPLPQGTIGADGLLEIAFDVTPGATPRAIGVNEDRRSLGLGLISLSVVPGKVAP